MDKMRKNEFGQSDGIGEIVTRASLFASDTLEGMFGTTRYRCEQACVLAIYDLFYDSQQADMFEVAIILVSYHVQGESRTVFKGGYPGYHTYALVSDVEGNWYAFSPANIFTDEEGDNDVIYWTFTNLEEAIVGVQEREGGLWPSVKVVKESLNEKGGKVRIGKKHSNECVYVQTAIHNMDDYGEITERADIMSHKVPTSSDE